MACQAKPYTREAFNNKEKINLTSNKFCKVNQIVSKENTLLPSEEGEALIALLPSYITPTTILISDKLPCHQAKIEHLPTEYLLGMLQRQFWVEGLYVRKKDLNKIKRYKDLERNYKNDFDERQFLKWVKAIEENTAICEMEHENVGKGIFVPPGKILPKDTFIISSGIIKLDPTVEELETKNHCSALQNLNSRTREIYGFIDPAKKGGILDLINHAPDREELANFNFKRSSVKERVATANLKSVIKFYNGYAIMGIEALEDIDGGEYGKQLLWSYAQSCEYLAPEQFLVNNKTLLLFDQREERNGEIIDPSHYALREITIFLDTGNPILLKAASLMRWELMEVLPAAELIISAEDSYSSNQSAAIETAITYGFLQAYLKRNSLVERVIIKVSL